MREVSCLNPLNVPVFLTSSDGKRVDIPSMSNWTGKLDDDQHAKYLDMVRRGRLKEIEPEKKKSKKAD